ncbi:hypothetical protein VP01_2434g3 [Puccinia sorghi]|uniref:Uncharacterized protein n=1 Tax=Puccinia sorghi TaxID=27349 RepID=A0A0L6V866_9BASI|nr:hypothetical protein VP01_2434g3 [Puccinia sorghi]
MAADQSDQVFPISNSVKHSDTTCNRARAKRPQKTTDELRKATSSKRIKLKIAQPRVIPVADKPQVPSGQFVEHIGIFNMKELQFLQLVFHMDVFQLPFPEFQLHKNRMDYINQNMKTSSGSKPVLVIQSSESIDFIWNFHTLSEGADKDKRGIVRPSASVLAGRKIIDCLSHLKTWKSVYQRRLGIDFFSSEQWIQNVIKKSERPISTSLKTRISEWLLIYLIYVDMIITILPPPNQVLVDRIQTFKRALTCFEEYTQFELGNDKTTNTKTISRLPVVWRYISHWKKADRDYEWMDHSMEKLSPACWKTFFNFVFASTIDSFTAKFQEELASDLSKKAKLFFSKKGLYFSTWAGVANT